MNELYSPRKLRLIRDVCHDAPAMVRDHKLVKTDKIAFLANHPALVQLADNNHGLLTRLAEVTGSPGLRKAADSPGWIHFAAEHPSISTG